MTDQSQMSPREPSPERLEELLAGFQPEPGPRLQQWARTAAWVQPISTSRRYVWAGLAAILILTFAGFLAFPSLRVIARRLMLSFIPAPADELNVQVTLSSPGELFNFASPENFPLTIQQAADLAGYQILQISPPPAGLMLVGAQYQAELHAATILYQGEGYDLFFSQRPLAGGEDFFSIGASASVELVQVEGVQGEYVAGGWKAEPGVAIPATISPGDEIELDATWDPNLAQYTLRWQDAGFVYELRSIGTSAPQKTELIHLAGLLK